MSCNGDLNILTIDSGHIGEALSVELAAICSVCFVKAQRVQQQWHIIKRFYTKLCSVWATLVLPLKPVHRRITRSTETIHENV